MKIDTSGSVLSVEMVHALKEDLASRGPTQPMDMCHPIRFKHLIDVGAISPLGAIVSWKLYDLHRHCQCVDYL